MADPVTVVAGGNDRLAQRKRSGAMQVSREGGPPGERRTRGSHGSASDVADATIVLADAAAVVTKEVRRLFSRCGVPLWLVICSLYALYTSR